MWHQLAARQAAGGDRVGWRASDDGEKLANIPPSARSSNLKTLRETCQAIGGPPTGRHRFDNLQGWRINAETTQSSRVRHDPAVLRLSPPSRCSNSRRFRCYGGRRVYLFNDDNRTRIFVDLHHGHFAFDALAFVP